MIKSIKKIQELDQPELSPYRELDQPFRIGEVFVAEGDKVVKKLLQSSVKIISIAVDEAWFDDNLTKIEKHQSEIQVYLLDRKSLEIITGYYLKDCVMATAQMHDPVDFNLLLSRKKAPLLVALDELADPDEIGPIVRNCAACGVDGLIIGENCLDPHRRRAVRKSMGTIIDIPVIYTDSTLDMLNEISSNWGCTLFALTHEKGSIEVYNADLSSSCCIIITSGFGYERNSNITMIKVPSLDPQNSDPFGVASSSGIVLYEALRQRMCNLLNQIRLL